MRCIRCYGQKRVLGIGGMEVDCMSCHGTGVNKIHETNSFGLGEEALEVASTVVTKQAPSYTPGPNRKQRAAQISKGK